MRDFAYPIVHPLHYGPPPEPSRPPSGMTTPASEASRRLSDPPVSWESRMGWDTGSWGNEGLDRGNEIPPILLDGHKQTTRPFQLVNECLMMLCSSSTDVNRIVGCF